MKARIQINGADILTDVKKELARVALLAVAKTANPFAKTASGISVKDDGTIETAKIGALYFDSPENVADKLSTMGDENAVITFYELPEGKTDERKVAEYNLHTFTARLRVAAKAREYVGVIFSDEKSEKKSGTKAEQDRDI